MPPAAPSLRTARPTVGVGATCRSSTSHPAAVRPARTALRSMSPLGRPSRLNTMRPPAVYEPKADAKASAARGVNPAPMMPRMPETLTMSWLSVVMEAFLSVSLHEAHPTSWRDPRQSQDLHRPNCRNCHGKPRLDAARRLGYVTADGRDPRRIKEERHG